MVDPYLYPGTSVLRNKIGIKDQQTLNAAEADLTYIRLKAIQDNPLSGSYDFKHLCAYSATPLRYNKAIMDKYYLTQEQWDEMVTAQLKETEKALDSGTLKLIPNKEAHDQIMRYIAEIAEKEHTKTAYPVKEGAL